jgi:hypothetical protein
MWRLATLSITGVQLDQDAAVSLTRFLVQFSSHTLKQHTETILYYLFSSQLYIGLKLFAI